jgi:hypothetical protein
VRLRSSQRCQGAYKGNPKGAQGRPRGSQRLPKGDQKGIQNGTQNGSRFLSRAQDPIFSHKSDLEHACAVQMTSEKTCLSNGTGSAFLSLETFGRVSQHIPKQPRSPHSCAWPTYLRIYLSIHLSSTLAKQAKTAYSHPKVYENTPQGPPK